MAPLSKDSESPNLWILLAKLSWQPCLFFLNTTRTDWKIAYVSRSLCANPGRCGNVTGNGSFVAFKDLRTTQGHLTEQICQDASNIENRPFTSTSILAAAKKPSDPDGPGPGPAGCSALFSRIR